MTINLSTSTSSLTATQEAMKKLQEELLTSINNPTNPVTENAEIQASLDNMSAVTSGVKSQVNVNVEAARAATTERNQILEELKAEQERLAAAKKVDVQVKTDTAIKTAEANKGAANTYRETTGSTQAREARQGVYQAYIDAQNDYNETVADAEASGAVMGFLKTIGPVEYAKQKLMKAQQALRTNQTITAASTTNLLNTFAENQAVEGARSGVDQAKAAKMVADTNIMIEKLTAQGNLTGDQIRGYGAQIGIEQSVMKQAVDELDVAIKRKQLTAAKAQDIMSKYTALDAMNKIDKMEIEADNAEVHKTNMESHMKDFLISMGRESEVGKVTYAASYEPFRSDRDNALVSEFNSYMRFSVSNTHPYVDVMQAYKNGVELTEDQKVVASYGDTVVSAFNSQKQAQLDALMEQSEEAAGNKARQDELKAQADAIRSTMINAQDPKDYAKVTELMRNTEKTIKTDATAAINSGAIQIPDMKQALTDERFADFQSLIPEDVKKSFLEGEYKDIDLSISSGDAGQSVSATFNSVVDAIQRTVSQFDDITQTQDVEYEVGKIATGMAGYYKATRKAAAKAYGLKGMDSLNISGVESFEATDWISGRKNTKKINLENGGEIKTLLMDNLRARRAKNSKPMQALTQRMANTGGLL